LPKSSKLFGVAFDVGHVWF